jgi:hypothetical protein
MIHADVIAQGGNAGITETTSADKFRLFNVRTNYWRLFLCRLELPPDKLAGDPIECALGREAVMLLLDVQGEHATRVECFVLAAT